MNMKFGKNIASFFKKQKNDLKLKLGLFNTLKKYKITSSCPKYFTTTTKMSIKIKACVTTKTNIKMKPIATNATILAQNKNIPISLRYFTAGVEIGPLNKRKTTKIVQNRPNFSAIRPFHDSIVIAMIGFTILSGIAFVLVFIGLITGLLGCFIYINQLRMRQQNNQ